VVLNHIPPSAYRGCSGIKVKNIDLQNSTQVGDSFIIEMQKVVQTPHQWYTHNLAIFNITMFGYITANEAKEIEFNPLFSVLKGNVKTAILSRKVEVSGDHSAFGRRFKKALRGEKVAKPILRELLQLVSPTEHALAAFSIRSHSLALAFQISQQRAAMQGIFYGCGLSRQ